MYTRQAEVDSQNPDPGVILFSKCPRTRYSSNLASGQHESFLDQLSSLNAVISALNRISLSASDQLAVYTADTLREQKRRRRFRRLLKEWKQQRGFTSSSHEMEACPAYHGLLAMGEHVVPLIMEKLEKGDKDHWFRILELVTTEQPVRQEDRGDYEKMREAWLDRLKQNF